MSTAVKGFIPTLVDGDRMDADEFLRRYEARPDLEHVQLLEGVVYMPSPITVETHGEPQGDLVGWMWFYKAHTHGVRSSAPGTVLLDWHNVPEPDGFLWIDAASGGQASISAKGYLQGSPDLIGEISHTSKDRDLGPKLQAYQRRRVREYIVWLVGESRVEWRFLQRGRFVLLKADEKGIIRSKVFPGLWLNVPALLAGHYLNVLRTLRRGLKSPEHAAFVAQLKKKAARRP